MSFYRERAIKATRVTHDCYGCGRQLQAGSPALYIAGTDENNGGIWHGHYHNDCRAAEVALNDLYDFRAGDEWLLLTEADDEDKPWLAGKYPEVFARLYPSAVLA